MLWMEGLGVDPVIDDHDPLGINIVLTLDLVFHPLRHGDDAPRGRFRHAVLLDTGTDGIVDPAVKPRGMSACGSHDGVATVRGYHIADGRIRSLDVKDVGVPSSGNDEGRGPQRDQPCDGGPDWNREELASDQRPDGRPKRTGVNRDTMFATQALRELDDVPPVAIVRRTPGYEEADPHRAPSGA